MSSSMKWIETFNKKGKSSGWKTIENDNIKLKIVKSMSSQLWIELNNEYVEEYKSFEISRKISELGKKRFVSTF